MDNNKILIEVYIPSIEKEYDIFVPISKRIGTVKELIENGLNAFNNSEFSLREDMNLYSKSTGEMYDVNMKIVDTDLQNGSKLILI